MSRWIKKTTLLPSQSVPVRVASGAVGDHDCAPPGDVDAGPRSIWECDCGRRWRIATPYWRGVAEPLQRAESLPEWVVTMSQTGSEAGSPTPDDVETHPQPN